MFIARTMSEPGLLMSRSARRFGLFPLAGPRALSRLAASLAALIAIAIAPAVRAEVAAPDYDDARYWSEAPMALLSDVAQDADLAGVDVFYIHPTTTSTKGLTNHDPLDPAVLVWTDESAIARQGSAFSACCRVFAPRYRAATSGALFSADREEAFDLAYSDIERAFDRYLAHDNGGRPFILAGHSQGAAHVATLLERRIEGTALKDRLVAAYVVGINLAEGDFGTRFPTLRPCKTARQTGCVMQWNAVMAGSDLAAIRTAFEKDYRARTGTGEGARTLCVNPVSFAAARPLTPSAEAQGAIPGTPGAGPMAAPRKGMVAARCDEGVLTVWTAPGLNLQSLPGGSMHFHDISLFWSDIRANALARSREFQRNIRQAGKP